MSATRKAFLAGIAVTTVSLLPAAATAAVGERAIMLTLYAKMKDPDAFRKYYLSTHAALIKQLPKIVSYEVSTGPITQELTQPAPFELISFVGFASMDDLHAALASPAGKAAVDDLKHFATGTSLLIFQTAST
ncbi:MAG: EthD family reductase [Candidatus Aquilonibacter sp.]